LLEYKNTGRILLKKGATIRDWTKKPLFL